MNKSGIFSFKKMSDISAMKVHKAAGDKVIREVTDTGVSC